VPETKLAPEPAADEAKGLRERIAELEGELSREKQDNRARGDLAFRRMADAAPLMIWAADPYAFCTYFNRSWLEFRGRSLEQEMGKGWAEGLHPEDRDLCVTTHVRCFEARQGFRMQYRLQRADGEYRWVEVTGVPRHEDHGFCGFLGSAADVTNQRKAVFAPDELAVRAVFTLTERERQVLILISEGRTTKEAALRLGISYKTADSHRSRILEKLGVHETASMVRYAIRAGLITP
jgi:PAS domain S-box-containing protein